MDFNDIQKAWNNDQEEQVELPTNLEKLQSANTPLDKIRKNLKNELISQLLAVVFIGFIPMYSRFPEKLVVVYYLLYAVMVAVIFYYLGKLFFFYKRINQATLNTKDSLYETYLDIRINMELYKTFNFALTPFVIIYILGSVFYNEPKTFQFIEGNLDTGIIIAVLITLIFSILSIAVVAEYWVHYFYGKYAKEIRKILNELKE